MYQKVHLRLTVLCSGITAVIMIVMSLCYLYVSETGLYGNHFHSFQNHMNTITANLEQQSVISMEWLSKMEAQGNYTFFVLDNGISFLYNQVSQETDSSRKKLLEESLAAYGSKITASGTADGRKVSPYVSYHTEFPFTSPSTGEGFYSSVIHIEKNSSLLQVIILSSLRPLKEQIFHQRIRFLLIDLGAVAVLSLFSWAFTGRLLRPILENQQKQVQFVAAASHELRTPLAVILSCVECCQGGQGQGKFLKIIKQESLRMSSLVNDMLLLSGSDNHRFPISKEPVELDTLLMNTCESFESMAREKSLSLSIGLPENILPPCSCDPGRIQQVVSILLHNAISYTREGGKINLSLSYQKTSLEKGNFSISVKDNGIGISIEDKKKIFDRFYRAERSRTAKGHFGLGLSIAWEIVATHQGSISVKDSETGGSLFTVTLPQ